MSRRLVGVGLCLLAIGACQRTGGNAGVAASPASPTSMAAMSVERPWKASGDWTITRVDWAGVPGVDKSLFGGRCSVLSDYLVSATFAGEATHAGRFSGTTSHCTQIEWSPQGPVGSTYSDGRGTLTTANGSTIDLRYRDGSAAVDPATGEMTFTDTFSFVGGTGLFEGATGEGREGGRFKDFTAVLGGTPVPMWMEGTITYGPGNGGR